MVDGFAGVQEVEQVTDQLSRFNHGGYTSTMKLINTQEKLTLRYPGYNAMQLKTSQSTPQ